MYLAVAMLCFAEYLLGLIIIVIDDGASSGHHI
jgi:hypothetical protein